MTQSGHGLLLGYPVKVSGNGTYSHATADTAANAEAIGIVIATDAAGANTNVTIALGGRITVDGVLPSGNLAAGTVLFMATSASKLVSAPPTGNNEVIKPMAVITYLNSEMIMLQHRGEVISTAGITLADDSVTNAKVATGIDAVKLADGSVTNTELQYINSLSSNAQTQLTAKAPLASPVFTTSIKITAASAPGSPTEGTIYYNTTSKVAYIWNGTGWSALNTGISLEATGGTISTAVSGYKYHYFLLAQTGNAFTPTVSGTVDYLVVAGGAAGGDANSNAGGGGGAGGFRTGTGLSVTANTAYTITVGAGGAVATNNVGGSGGNSVFSTITSAGGGGGGAQSVTITGVAGGSGGGGTYNNGAGGAGNTPSTSPVQGFKGGDVDAHGNNNAAAGGGGGASAAGGDATQATSGGGVGNGGAGENNIMGMNDADSYSHLTTLSLGHVVSGARYFAGGGAGEAYENGAGTGGAGGGGIAATAGTANTGGGGGGGSNGGTNRTAGAGGSGIVIIRYPA